MLVAPIPTRRKDLRITKYSLLVIALVFTISGCSGCKKDSESAADAMIKKHKSVRVGIDPANIPFASGSGTEVQGLDADIAKEIVKDYSEANKELGRLELMWIKTTGYNKIYDALANGEVEFAISTLAVDPKRADKFAYSKPYYESDDAIAYRMVALSDTAKKYETLDSLSGMKVGVASGRPSDIFMSAQKGVSLVKFDSIDLALGALNLTEVDAVVGDRPIMTYSTFESFQNATIAPVVFNTYKYAAVVRKDETKLLDLINKTLDRMISSGQIAELKKTWYEDKEQEAIKKRGKWQATEELKKAPKSIHVTIRKSRPDFKMDRLDGFQLVLQGSAGRFTSSHITTTDNSGSCNFGPVPPGEYTLDMSKILQTVAKVMVPEKAVKSLTMEIDIGRQLSIIVK
jgi:polar amino acid transport system substrate-binding protein